MASKETELAFAKCVAQLESKSVEEKLKAFEEKVTKLQAKLNQEKDQHRQIADSNKELEDKQQGCLEAARAEVTKQYKESQEHTNEFMVAHQVGMEIFWWSVKDAGFLK